MARRGPPNAAGAAIVQKEGKNWKGRGLESTRTSQREIVLFLFLFGVAVPTAAAGAGVIINAFRLF